MSKVKSTVTSPELSDTSQAANVPSHGVYVVEGEGDDAYWTRVGAAWLHRDGQGFNVALSAVPLTGRLVLRVRKDREG
jgi:hypothetical protein